MITVLGCDDGNASKSAKASPTDKAAAAPAKTPTPPPPAAEGAQARAPVAEAPPPAADDGAAVGASAADAGAAEAGDPVPSAEDAGTPEDMAAADAGAEDEAEAEAEAEGEDGGEAMTASGAEITDPIDLTEGAQLLRLVLAHDVVDRLPVDPATEFPAGHKINLFVEATNADAEQTIQVTWENTKTGRRTPATTLTIPVRKLHRTRAYRTMKRPGDYRVIVLSADERELASLSFTVAE